MNSHSFSRPQLKSLGTPDKPTGAATAIQLEAGPGHTGPHHSHWRLAAWARRMKADTAFPLQQGRLGVPSPGLYLVFAQVTAHTENDIAARLLYRTLLVA